MYHIDLLIPLETFHDLHELVDTRKATVKVGRDVLAHLLIDYTCMLQALQQHTSLKVRTEPPKRRREVIKV